MLQKLSVARACSSRDEKQIRSLGTGRKTKEKKKKEREKSTSYSRVQFMAPTRNINAAAVSERLTSKRVHAPITGARD